LKTTGLLLLLSAEVGQAHDDDLQSRCSLPSYLVTAAVSLYWSECGGGRRGYSVRELAKRTGVGFVTVSRIENGHMSSTVVMQETLATALNLNVTALFPPPGQRR